MKKLAILSILILCACSTTRLEDQKSAPTYGTKATGDTWTSTNHNELYNAVVDNDTRLDGMEAIIGLFFGVGDGTYTTITGVSSTEVGYLSGVTSDIQTQINAKVSTESINTAAELETVANLGAFFSDYADDANAAAMRTTLGLTIGTNVAAAGANSDITSLTGLTTPLGAAYGGAGADTSAMNGLALLTLGVVSAAVVDTDYVAPYFTLAPADNTVQGGFRMAGAVAGEALSAFQLVYKKTDARYYKYDANGTDKASWPLPVAMTITAASGAGETCSLVTGVFFLKTSTYTNTFSSVGAVPVYASETAGGITLTAPSDVGDKVIIVGHLWGDDRYLMNLPAMVDVEVE